MFSGGIRTHNLSNQEAADLRFRPRGHRDRLLEVILTKNLKYILNQSSYIYLRIQ
jgi:hypothetical protein